jgi:outer membrane receptor protein involved in Fe transport
LARGRFDTFERNLYIGHFPADAALGRDSDTVLEPSSDLWGVELQYSFDISVSMNAIIGVVYEDSKTDPYRFVFTSDGETSPFSAYLQSYDNQDSSIYGQLSWHPMLNLSVVLGGRLNDNSDAEKRQFVPRLGVVYALGQDMFLKLLYGEAFRNPDFFEKYVATNGVLWGDPALNREEISNLELGFDATINAMYSFRANAFHLETDELITRRNAILNPNGAEYFNSNGQKISGAELELKVVPSSAQTYYLNISYKTGDDLQKDSELLNISQWTGNLVYSHKFNKSFQARPADPASTWVAGIIPPRWMEPDLLGPISSPICASSSSDPSGG